MNCNISSHFMANAMRRGAAAGLVGLLGLFNMATPTAAQTVLADQPIFSTVNVPGNLALTLSVEYPTAISVANLGNYADASTYLGYFDFAKCYNYVYNSATPSSSYFQPAALATGSNGHSCSGLWSGNFMNWATTQTIDPFRWALTGGYRSVDNATGGYPLTVLEKAWGSLQGSTVTTANGWNSTSFPFRGTDQASPNNLPKSLVATVTPFSNWQNFNSAIYANGNQMVFSGTTIANSQATQNTGYYFAYGTTQSNGNTTVTSSAASNTSVYTLQNSLTNVNVANQPNTFRVYIRVAVCDPTTSMGLAGLESNCTKYGSIYKPEGLMQQYANKVRYGVLSYLNTNTGLRQGGVLREPMRFIGPTYPQPLSSAVTTNATPEWDPATGVQSTNPDPTTASASNVSESGVLNYLNKFGEYAASVGNYKNTYMSGDNVSELYYAALRYFENLGNVPEWANSPTTTELDGFPAVATWSTSASASSTAADPILYTCQQNFILGIGDDHTHFDYNVGGSTATGQYPPTRPVPSTVGADALNQASTWTANLQNLETLEAGSSSSLFPTTPWWYFHNPTGGPTTDTDATYFIAGLAYGAHVNDIRPDLADTQTISTYWLDVEEYGYPENLNPYDMAAKYGGFTVPSGYTISNTTPLTAGEYDTSGNTMLMGPTLSYTQNLPDNYFLAGNASAMVSGLSSAVAKIASYIKPLYSNAFSFSGTSVAASTNTESFASEYFPATWTSTITGSTITFDSSGTPTITPQWSTDTTLLTQLAGTGWQSSGRNVATWNGSAGVAFEATALGATTPGAALLATLNKPSYSTGTSSTQLLNYLRGDRTNEVGSTVSGSSQSLRARTLLLGDIVDASLTPVSTPQQVFSDANNPGYAKFKSNWANRPTMVYAGANDGMVHGFVGSSGAEQFAYVPSALFQGPSGTPVVNGLAALGNPAYAHRFYVDATPVAYDIDLGNTGGTKGTPNWHTLLIGGLGKGGESFYAIDVTDPANMNTESVVAGKVKWEFSNSTSGVGGTLGYSFGTPVVVKTVQYGWVVAFTSGYDGSSTVGYLYIVNPATGALLQKIATPSASSGLTQASAYVKDYSDYTADSVYVGDLNGQLWRFDLTAASGTYPAPTQIATLQDASGNAQPVTTAPLIEISPTTRERYVMVGTGQLLSSNDMSTVNPQTFYAILDGTSGGFNPDPTPIMRSLLTPVTDVTAGITTLPAAFKGWYYDLGLDSASGVAWRVDQNPIAYNGIVSFSALLPAITDPCKPSGHSEVYAVNYATAKSVIQASSTSSTIVAYYSIASAVTSEKFFMNNGNPELVVGCASGCVTPIPASLNTPIATRLLNWREVPSAE